LAWAVALAKPVFWILLHSACINNNFLLASSALALASIYNLSSSPFALCSALSDSNLYYASWVFVLISIANETAFCKFSNVDFSTGSTDWISTFVTLKLFNLKKHSPLIFPVSLTPKILFLINFADVLWNSSNDTLATADLTLEAN